MARFGQAEVTALLVEGGAAAVSGAVQRLAWEQGSTNTMGWAATAVAFLGGAVGSAYMRGPISDALKATSHGAAAIAGFLAAEKTLLNVPKRVPRDSVRAELTARYRARLGAGDSVSTSGASIGQKRLLFSVTR